MNQETREQKIARLTAHMRSVGTEIVCTKSMTHQRNKVKVKSLIKGHKYLVYPTCSIDDKFWFWTIIAPDSPTGFLHFRDAQDYPVEFHRLKYNLQGYFVVPEDLNKSCVEK